MGSAQRVTLSAQPGREINLAFCEVRDGEAKYMLVVDLCDELGGRSVTNGAEEVIHYLQPHADQRVLYQDTMSQWDELKHNGLDFTGFAPLSHEMRHRCDELWLENAGSRW